jgi:RNA polymerase sigma factor for flagellar operon FliA
VDRYKPERGLFQTYARYRIQGEIMEYLRSLDWVSRSVRAWGRKVGAARARLTTRFGREASSEEVATELGLPLHRYYRLDRKLNEALLLSLENLSLVAEEEWQKAQEEAFQNPFQDPLIFLENKDLLEKMAVVIEELPERERLVLTLYYYEELTLQEIGEILELTEGRISQIHLQAVSRLRAALSGKPRANP